MLQIYLLVLFVALRTILPKVMKNAIITPAMTHSIHSITNPPIHSFFDARYYQVDQLQT